MRIFFDTEFYENGRTIDLISIGMVREDGATFYGEVDFAGAIAGQSSWLSENVKPHLKGGDAEMSRYKLKQGVLELAGENPEFWANYAGYDWVVLCQLFGTMMRLPKGWPMFCRDIQQLRDDRGRPDEPQQRETEHNALSDARWTKELYDWLHSVAA